MTLFSTSFWSAVATVLRLASLLIIAKVLAQTGGPMAVAMFGQFQNFLIVVVGLSGVLFRTGIVKYAAEYREQPKQLVGLFATVLKVASGITILGSLLLLLFHKTIAIWLMDQIELAPLFLLAGVVLPLMVMNGLALGLLNGMGHIKHYLIINASVALINMLAILFIIYFVDVSWALYGLLIGPVITGGIATYFVVHMHREIIIESLKHSFDFVWASNIGRFAAMSLVMLLMSPLVQIGVRNEIVSQLGWVEAGYWQAVWQVSNAYLAVITAGFSVYYLPKLSRLTEVEDIRKEMLRYYRTALPIIFVLAMLVYFLRDYILYILYSDAFQPAAELFAWQIAGDMMKVISWVMAYMLIAKGMVKLTIGSEIVFGGATYALNLWLIPVLGIKSPVIVYFLIYLAHAIFCWFVIGRHYLLYKKKEYI
jgi:O-antigen/teichoic acid export membrane protein